MKTLVFIDQHKAKPVAKAVFNAGETTFPPELDEKISRLYGQGLKCISTLIQSRILSFGNREEVLVLYTREKF